MSRLGRQPLLGPLTLAVLLGGWALPAAGATYYVGGPGCSPTGPGTPTSPYCTIQQAVNARGGPGTTILVRGGSYLERVGITSAQSGAVGNPFVIQAEDSLAVQMNGLGVPGWTWMAVTSDIYSTPLAVGPRVLLVDGTRLTGVFPPLADSTSLPAGNYEYVNGTLYVNFGAGGPTGHTIQVPTTTVGFEIRAGAANVVLSSFEIIGATNHAIRIYPTTGGSSPDHVTVTGCRTRFGELQGINVVSASDVVLRDNTIVDQGDHGILLQSVAQALVEHNECARNARMIDTRTGAGIRLFTSDGAVVRNNRLHHNEDTGLEFIGCSGGLSLQNRSWGNGNHGFDHILATTGSIPTRNIVHIGDVAYGNAFDGFSLEAGVSGIQIHNSILVANGVPTNRYNLYIQNGGEAGFQSGSNILWNPPPSPPPSIVQFKSLPYATLQSFRDAFPGEPYEIQSLQLDPMFVDPDAGDFRLRAGSPAIDAANSSLADWPARDAEDVDRSDDPSTPNTGTAPIPWAERGALEYLSSEPPLAVECCRSCESGGFAEPGFAPELGVSGNPLGARGSIQVTVHVADRFVVDVIDLMGRRVGTLLDDAFLPPGVHSYPMDADVRSGVYFVRLRTGSGQGCRKVIFIR